MITRDMLRESLAVQEWLQEGRAEGRIEGRAEGRAEVEQRTRQTIREILAARFPGLANSVSLDPIAGLDSLHDLLRGIALAQDEESARRLFVEKN